MDYQQYTQSTTELVKHLFYGQIPSMDELIEHAKRHERVRNAMVLYSLNSSEDFYTFLQAANEDPKVQEMLLDLHTALKVPYFPPLRSLTRMLRHLPFYEQTGYTLDRQGNKMTTASQQIAKLLLSLNRLYNRKVRKMSPEKHRYVTERRADITLIKR
ncbi:hypothetical protein BEP19_00515 [Ammoniphilus oxalaticus]|uniref:Uncharacterized protein n=1 Tax=Ammoniphilus oxalaticus TaxID=66863 RepID=A0A419SRG2_9BACL|nr:hypothetical protein [Ammoniphilus oxalaticus]RKD27089.1 hypothetical protein BEP19_00515 [Ammoniphilus oxalaticus]